MPNRIFLRHQKGGFIWNSLTSVLTELLSYEARFDPGICRLPSTSMLLIGIIIGFCSLIFKNAELTISFKGRCANLLCKIYINSVDFVLWPRFCNNCCIQLYKYKQMHIYSFIWLISYNRKLYRILEKIVLLWTKKKLNNSGFLYISENGIRWHLNRTIKW